MINKTGATPLLPILAMAGAGQVGAAFALWVKCRRNRQLTNLIKGSASWNSGNWRTLNLRGNVTTRTAVHHCMYRWWDRWCRSWRPRSRGRNCNRSFRSGFNSVNH